MRGLRKLERNRSGSTAVEFAFTAPFFLGFMFAIVECAILLWTQYGLQYGAEAAARCATVDSTTCGTASQIASYAASKALGLNPPSSTFTASTAGCGNLVQANYAYSFLTPFLGTPSVTLTAQSCFPKSS